ncbi:calcium/proton exchanger [Candidatus Berkiella aquae]|uniref:Ca(2+)/H(+) antiporter n=1 Tax=Candidatus Berkiella aquae TaxID=295108 RepID=A0A0Q9YPF0_9GAMM|nr:calcium/proton exchanger [Candidatus Berkiella aquae]MCS5710507.1 calcium/proton exchanger [Candidatus Berkiella aquae]
MKSLLKPTLNWLLPFIPIAVLLEHGYPEKHTFIFLSACVAIIPLAALLGRATEGLAARIGEAWGGILNATFGNAAELIISIVALHAGQIQIVKASLIGSLIGNVLLVLGASFLAGGLKYPIQKFNLQGAKSQSIDFSIAAIALIIPAAFFGLGKEWMTAETVNQLSVVISVILITVYFLSMFFTLYTHRSFFSSVHHENTEEKHAVWSLKLSIFFLILSAALIAWMSEILVGSVTQAATAMGMSQVFVGVIIVAVVGNAAEHSTAIVMALKNRLDLSLVIAIGSGIQIALFVTPLLVILSFLLPLGKMDLIFGKGEILVVVLASYILNQITEIGESTWYKGIQLLTVYSIMAVAFYLFK